MFQPGFARHIISQLVQIQRGNHRLWSWFHIFYAARCFNIRGKYLTRYVDFNIHQQYFGLHEMFGPVLLSKFAVSRNQFINYRLENSSFQDGHFLRKLCIVSYTLGPAYNE